MRLMPLLLAALTLPVAAHAQRGVPQDGFPGWQERMMLVLANRARAAPTEERYNSCGISTVRPPMVRSYNLDRVARFHSANLAKTGRFQHDSPCTLVSNISALFEPGGSCDGSASCACVGGTVTCNPDCTIWSSRLALFGVTGGGRAENIARGQTTPRQVHDGWMNSSGHCSNILGGYVSFGGGWVGNYWTQNFSSTGNVSGTLIAGGHEPQWVGSSATNIELRVNYYDTRGGPLRAEVNIDGECTPMILERGSGTNGTYLVTASLSGTSCRSYVFVFEGPQGEEVLLPESGSYGLGGSSCTDWMSQAPPACDGSVDLPSVHTAAAADPNPVIGTMTTVSVLGAHRDGESSLVYTWSFAGPAAVAFGPNGTNAAKGSVATFTRAGDYSLEVLITDALGQTTSSSVDVEVITSIETITVTPGNTRVEIGASRLFSAGAVDQFADSLDAPVFTWSVDGGGAIDQDGLFVAGDTVGGPHTVRASAGGREGTATVTVVEEGSDTTPPEVAIVSPADGDVVVERTLWIVAEAEDDVGVAQVSFEIDGEIVAVRDSPPWEIGVDMMPREPGELVLVAIAEDPEGNQARSEPVRVRRVESLSMGGDCGCATGNGSVDLPMLLVLMLCFGLRRRVVWSVQCA